MSELCVMCDFIEVIDFEGFKEGARGLLGAVPMRFFRVWGWW